MPARPRILLMITGSVAAYKALDVARGLKAEGAEVTCVLTEGAQAFITPLSAASLTGNPAYTDLFSLKDETEMGHIRLAREADAILVAPASADFIAKMAHGLCDDLASTIFLAAEAQVPVFVAPAMNGQMWEHKATQRNVQQLKVDGVVLLGPDDGEMACGEVGDGRMMEPEGVIHEVLRRVQGDEGRVVRLPSISASGRKTPGKNTLLEGVSVLITSGPTREKIDPVRYLSNYSSGKQGHAIAGALAAAGADVTLVSGPTAEPNPPGVQIICVESARNMQEACEALLPVDVAICAAAVADWRASDISVQKIKKLPERHENITFTFAENPDILVSLSKRRKARPALVIGFAAETEHVLENARVKLEDKGCDWIVANDVSGGAVFGAEENAVHLITKQDHESWESLPKEEVAERLARRIARFFEDKKRANVNEQPTKEKATP